MKKLSVWVSLGLAVCVASLAVAGDCLAAESANLRPLITTSELVLGNNRFAFGLLQNEQLLEGAEVELRVFELAGPEGRLVATLNAPYRTVEKLSTKPSLHRHSDGSLHAHGTDNSVRGLYVTEPRFERAGAWGMEIRRRDGAQDAVRFMVDVLDRSPSPAIGAAAPRSRNLIARDVKALKQIDSSNPPDPRLHQVRIADAIAQNKPQLIVFATPQFCTSRMCGPVVDIVRGLIPRYGKQLALVHQEIWQDFANKKMFATVEEWRLETEPWVFVVDGQGMVRAKFEGLVTTAELEAVLQLVLSGPLTKTKVAATARR